MEEIKVFIVDDSAVVRQVMTNLLSDVPGLTVIGSAPDPIAAEKKMLTLWPDVILLDVEMPKMDGITFLKHIMKTRPTPVVICSTLTVKGADTTINALAAGAVEVIAKPTSNLKDFLQNTGSYIGEAIRGASKARMNKVAQIQQSTPISDNLLYKHGKPLSSTTERIIALGTSTGGTQALERVLTKLPKTTAGIVIVQHMPEAFTSAFAKRLDSLCQITVKEAEDNDRVLPGTALIAPGGKHLLVRRSGAQYRVEVKDGPLVTRHKPSVNVLFRSVAKSAGRNAIGVIMTGMGDDGAIGLKEMRDAGALTLGQNEDSCVVYGMPKEAKKLGGVYEEINLDEIPALLIRFPTTSEYVKTNKK